MVVCKISGIGRFGKIAGHVSIEFRCVGTGRESRTFKDPPEPWVAAAQPGPGLAWPFINKTSNGAEVSMLMFLGV